MLLVGCSHLDYLVQAGAGQLALYNHERDLTEVIDDPRTPDGTREALKWVPEIKKFVEDELGEKATGNYTTYVDLKRPYVIWSLTVAPPFSLEAREWSFPIVGSFPYLGFFKEEAAREWAKEEEANGNDTHVRGVTAYSTLGYLRDPLLSSMLTRRKTDLVNLIFHETTHGVVYPKGYGSFNEQAASYVGDYGERLWVSRKFGEGKLGAESPELRTWSDERDDRRAFGKLLRAFADELRGFYSSSETMDAVARKQQKEALFAAFRARLAANPWKAERTRKNVARSVAQYTNNAAVAAVLTYEDEQDVFDLLHEKCAGSLKDSLRLLKSFSDSLPSAAERDRMSRDNSNVGKSAQALLRDLLRREAGRGVCLDVQGR